MVVSPETGIMHRVRLQILGKEAPCAVPTFSESVSSGLLVGLVSLAQYDVRPRFVRRLAR